MKYIDAEKLTKAIEDKGLDCSFALKMERLDTLALIDELQQERPNDVRAEIEEYYGEDLAFEDERTKAAYHFFSAGKAFELREYEEEREKHMMDLLNNFQKGMNAGYEKAISELKEGKVECSPIMKELIDKLFGIGNTFNFGFGPKNIQQEQSEVDLENYISNKLRELGADLINHKPYSFNRGLNVGKTDAYHDILGRLSARKEEEK